MTSHLTSKNCRPRLFLKSLSQTVDSPPPVSTLAKTRATLRICHNLYFRLPLPNYHWQMIFTFLFFSALGEDFLAESPGAKKKKRQLQTAGQSSNVVKLTTRQIVGQDISVEPHMHTLIRTHTHTHFASCSTPLPSRHHLISISSHLTQIERSCHGGSSPCNYGVCQRH